MGVASASGSHLPQNCLTGHTDLNGVPLKSSPVLSESAALPLANVRLPFVGKLKPLTQSDNLVLVFGSGEISSELAQDFLPSKPGEPYKEPPPSSDTLL